MFHLSMAFRVPLVGNHYHHAVSLIPLARALLFHHGCVARGACVALVIATILCVPFLQLSPPLAFVSLAHGERSMRWRGLDRGCLMLDHHDLLSRCLCVRACMWSCSHRLGFHPVATPCCWATVQRWVVALRAFRVGSWWFLRLWVGT